MKHIVKGLFLKHLYTEIFLDFPQDHQVNVQVIKQPKIYQVS